MPAALTHAFERRDAEHYFSVWAFLWAAATLFYLGSRPADFTLWSGALTVAAVIVLWGPGQVWRIGVCAALQLIVLYQQLPAVSNHWLYTGFINLGLLLSLAAVLVRGQRSDGSFHQAIWDIFAPIGRLGLLLIYFFAVLHKLNWDFFDSSHSCAVTLYTKIAARYPIAPQWEVMKELAIWGTIAVEALIPMLLYSARYRPLGILFSIGLHTIITLNPVYINFSSMILASLALWVFDGSRRTAQPISIARRRLPLWCSILGSALTVGAGYLFLEGHAERTLPEMVQVLWWLYLLVVGSYLLVRCLQGQPRDLGAQLLTARSALSLLVPVLLIFNGICPYIGLKTETSFAMYSNLRTERKQFNHILIPSWVQLFRYQDDLVEIKASSHKLLKRHARRGELINYVMLQELARQGHVASVVFERSGEKIKIADISTDEKLTASRPAWKRKFLYFRPVPKNGVNSCQH
ncbi:MAG: hypothetical protein EBZ48_05845 [Proteobacteria bacterium]|nr:hypothetical protein [Pseudomonadota bacterium]